MRYSQMIHQEHDRNIRMLVNYCNLAKNIFCNIFKMLKLNICNERKNELRTTFLNMQF